MVATTPKPGPYHFGAFRRVRSIQWGAALSEWYPLIGFKQIAAAGWIAVDGNVYDTGNPDLVHDRVRLDYSEVDGGSSWSVPGNASVLRLQPVLRDRVTLEVSNQNTVYPDLLSAGATYIYGGGAQAVIGPHTYRQFLSLEFNSPPTAQADTYNNRDQSIEPPTLPFWQSPTGRWLTANAT